MDYNYLIKKIVKSQMEKTAIDKEHKRLQEDLENWSNENNFTESVKNYFNGEIIPDIVKYNPISKLLLIGDAKDSTNETSNRNETRERIFSYIGALNASIDNEFIKGGVIAIVTNNEVVANGWSLTLSEICKYFNLVNVDETQANFGVEKYKEKTWIIR